MKYIREAFGIKSAKQMEKHITKITAIEVMCIKMQDVVRVIWARENKLNHYDIKAHVMYCIRVEDLEQAVQFVLESVKPNVKVISDLKDFVIKMGMHLKWVDVDDVEPILTKIYEDKILPFFTTDSLHITEERYEIDGVIYRLFSGIGHSGNPTVQRLEK